MSFEIFIQLLSGIVTPVVLVIVGKRITNSINSHQNNKMKEYDWEKEWAGMFIDLVKDYNENTSEFLTLINKSAQGVNEKMEIEIKEKLFNQRKLFYDIEIITIAFEIKSRGELIDIMNNIGDDIRKSFSTNELKLDSIRASQINFMKIAREIHTKLLHID